MKKKEQRAAMRITSVVCRKTAGGRFSGWVCSVAACCQCSRPAHTIYAEERESTMIQDIAPHHFDNAYHPVPPDGDSIVLCYEGRTCLMKKTEEEFLFPRLADLEKDNKDIYKNYTYLFQIDEERYYLVTEVNREGLSDFTMEDISVFRQVDPQHRAFAGITGYQLYQWYQAHRYCGRCGYPTKQDVRERMLYCEKCRSMEYPKICPAVIIAVTDGNRLLLSKYAGREYKKYALLAGYTEIGETMEETVAREVMEEVGLRVKNIRYYKSQPWAFSGTILMGFYCDLDGSGEIRLDEEELALAEWFEREEIPVEPSRDSLTNEMIMRFKNGN